jgi:hypothetical protein
MAVARVYAAINAVAVELAEAGVAKGHFNLENQYAYRSVDDVYNRVGPVLAKHKLCFLPRILERDAEERSGSLGDVILHVTVRAAFDFVSVEDGSSHVVEAFGEALDSGDKGTAKAMQSAFKYALLQAFCVPLGPEDADARSPRLKPPLHAPAPVQGWEQWSRDVLDMIRGCQTSEALGRVQDRYRSALRSLARERADLCSKVGAVMAERRGELAAPKITRGARSSSAHGANCAQAAAPEHAPRAKRAAPKNRASRAKPPLTKGTPAGAKPTLEVGDV